MTSEEGVKQVVILGAGGHARVLIDCLRLMVGVEPAGLLDKDTSRRGTELDGVPIIGDDGYLAECLGRGIRHAIIGLGSTGDASARRRLYELAESQGFELISAIHPSAVIAASVQIGRGAAIMAGTVMNPGVRLGKNIIVNTGAIVDHDCVLGDHAHIAPGATLSGTVTLGDEVHVGTGASAACPQGF